MTSFCLTIALFLSVMQNLVLFPIWDEKGKAGFIDINGNMVIEPKFNNAPTFSEGLAPAEENGKWGFADRTGNFVIKPRFVKVEAFSEGLAAVSESMEVHTRSDRDYSTTLYRCGYIDKTGNWVIQPKLRESCGNFREGFAVIKIDESDPEYQKGKGVVGYLDKKGNWAISPRFQLGNEFINGIAWVSDGYKDGTEETIDYYIDKTGARVTNIPYCGRMAYFSEGVAVGYKKGHGFDGYINEKCEYVMKLPDGVMAHPGESYFSEGLAAVYTQRKRKPGESEYTYLEKSYGYMDRTGKMVIPFQFPEAKPFSEGLAVVKDKEGNRIYINHRGEKVFDQTWISAGDFKNGLAFQFICLWTISESSSERNIYGYMNKQGKYVWLSPRAEVYLSKEWIEKNYIGPQKFEFKKE